MSKIRGIEGTILIVDEFDSISQEQWNKWLEENPCRCGHLFSEHDVIDGHCYPGCPSSNCDDLYQSDDEA